MYSAASQLLDAWPGAGAQGNASATLFDGSIQLASYQNASSSTTTTTTVSGQPTMVDASTNVTSHRNLFACMAHDPSCAHEYGVKLLILLAFALPNVVSSKLVGLGVASLGLLVMSPYIALSILGLPQIRLANYRKKPAEHNVHQLLSVLYWSLSGFDSASTFAGEVEKPSSTYPIALSLACLVMLLCYLLPLGVAAGADGRWMTWTDGSLAVAARRIGGPWLSLWVAASSLLSNWGLFASTLLEDSYQLLGMAEVGLMPSCFAHRQSRLGTPTRAIALQVAIVALLAGLDFSVIMCVDNFFSAAAAALEFAAAVQLRRRKPYLPRPYRVPLGTAGLTLLLLLPLGISVLVMAVTAMHSRLSLVLCGSATVVGVLGYLPYGCNPDRPPGPPVSPRPSPRAAPTAPIDVEPSLLNLAPSHGTSRGAAGEPGREVR